MLITIEELRQRVTNDCEGLVADLQELTGRFGTEEAHAWQASLYKLSEVFKANSFQPLHLYFGSRGNLALEYQLPASSSWCDVVMLGEHDTNPSAVIIELKDWVVRNDRPGRYEGLIEHQGCQVLHPSEQVRGYTEYFRRFHSTVADYSANVFGCVLFTRDTWADSYSIEPNSELVKQYPFFTVSNEDIDHRFSSFFKSRLTSPNERFARDFAEGHYRQERGFTAQIGAQILRPGKKVFELLDNQRKAFSICWGAVRQLLSNTSPTMPPKKVFIIKGPPGSGKSVIAARLWASLVTANNFPEGDIIFTTTSLSQNSNWAYLFNSSTGIEAASGVVRKATTYTPVTTQRLGQLRRKHGKKLCADAEQWRENLNVLRALGESWRDGALDNQNLVSIVDEAHALINPEEKQGRGQFGFATTLGPQAYHIIRSSLITVFLLDPMQGFRQRENTSIDNIRAWSMELGAAEPEIISLEGVQFRCAGSEEYVSWIESVLEGSDPSKNKGLVKRWKGTTHLTIKPDNIIQFPKQTKGKEQASKVAEKSYSYGGDINDLNTERRFRKGLDFRIFDNPEAMETELKKRNSEGYSVRLLSTYSRPWRTEKASNPHVLPPEMKDFNEPYSIDGQRRFWSRIWNYVPKGGNDYTWYVSGHPASKIANDPLCEVGCPYAVRGFDYDYVGILWLNDFLWNGKRWQVDPNFIEERGIMNLVSQAKRERRKGETGTATVELIKRVMQAYRILFTRALRGFYVWIPDPKTREYIIQSM